MPRIDYWGTPESSASYPGHPADPGTLKLLPALPSAWPTGTMEGVLK